MVGLATDVCNEHTKGPTSITHQVSGGHHDIRVIRVITKQNKDGFYS